MAFLFDSHPSVEKENRKTFIHLLHFLDYIYVDSGVVAEDGLTNRGAQQ